MLNLHCVSRTQGKAALKAENHPTIDHSVTIYVSWCSHWSLFRCQSSGLWRQIVIHMFRSNVRRGCDWITQAWSKEGCHFNTEDGGSIFVGLHAHDYTVTIWMLEFCNDFTLEGNKTTYRSRLQNIRNIVPRFILSLSGRKKKQTRVELEVLTAVVLKIFIFWDITPCSPVVSFLAYSSSLKMEVIHSSETWTNFDQTTWRYILFK
jgi:hypothetical protein